MTKEFWFQHKKKHFCVYSPSGTPSNHPTNNNNEPWLKRVFTQTDTPNQSTAAYNAKHFDVSHSRTDFNRPSEGNPTKSYKKGRQIR